jgi:hypothetical protein
VHTGASELAADVEATQLLFECTRPRQCQCLHRQGDVVDAYADEPQPQEIPPAAAGDESEDAERGATHGTSDELGSNKVPSPASSCAAPHICSGEPSDVEEDHVW